MAGIDVDPVFVADCRVAGADRANGYLCDDRCDALIGGRYSN